MHVSLVLAGRPEEPTLPHCISVAQTFPSEDYTGLVLLVLMLTNVAVVVVYCCAYYLARRLGILCEIVSAEKSLITKVRRHVRRFRTGLELRCRAQQTSSATIDSNHWPGLHLFLGLRRHHVHHRFGYWFERTLAAHHPVASSPESSRQGCCGRDVRAGETLVTRRADVTTLCRHARGETACAINVDVLRTVGLVRHRQHLVLFAAALPVLQRERVRAGVALGGLPRRVQARTSMRRLLSDVDRTRALD